MGPRFEFERRLHLDLLRYYLMEPLKPSGTQQLLNRQKFYREKYKKINPEWSDSLGIYADLIDQEITPETRILDVGCGRGDFLRSVYAKTKYTYGIDPDKWALKRNPIIRNKYIGFAEELPFEDNFFDLVVSAWVLEHLDDPQKAFQEIFRVLKPGGKFIFLTPNSWNYIVLVNRLIPHAFHAPLTRRLYGRQRGDAYPVRYRVNSVKKIDRLLRWAGFKRSQLILNGDPTYISFNDLLFKLSCLVERILSWKGFKSFRIHIIGVYRK